MHVLI